MPQRRHPEGFIMQAFVWRGTAPIAAFDHSAER
jgi:hypothetical protein